MRFNLDGARDPSLLSAMGRVVDAIAVGDVDFVLNEIVDVALTVVDGSCATSIVLVDARVPGGLRFAAARGFSRAFIDEMESDPEQFRTSVPASAIREGRPILVLDVQADPEYRRWWRVAKQEDYHSLLATPMSVDEVAIGSLNVYRRTSDELPEADIELVALFARFAASALQTSRLLADRDNQVAALGRLVKAMQDQTHEHANRLQAIGGMIALGRAEDAATFITEISEARMIVQAEIHDRVSHSTVAGLLVALSAVAAQQGIELEIDESSALDRLPESLTDSQIVTIIGNLVDNAIDAAADLHPVRRVVRVAVIQRPDQLIIEVRDWGSGLRVPLSDALSRGVTTKDEHAGAGLALVHRVVEAALGSLQVSSHGGGTTFTVRIPFASERSALH